MWKRETQGTILSSRIIEFQIKLDWTWLFLAFCENAPRQYKNVIVSPRSKARNNVQSLSYAKDMLVLNEEKEMKKNLFWTGKKVKSSTRVLLCLK